MGVSGFEVGSDMPQTRVVGFSAPASPTKLQRSSSFAISPLSQMLSNLRSEEERFLQGNSRMEDGFTSADSDDTDIAGPHRGSENELLDTAAIGDGGGRKCADIGGVEGFACEDPIESPKFVPADPIDIPYNNDGYRHWRR